jgi:translation initiation factor 2B subunit (eIF-2B alpha/beta/delta family)
VSFQEHAESAEARFRRGIGRLGHDRRSGSSLIADRALRLLGIYARQGWHQGSPRLLRSLTRALCRAHPTMALLRAVEVMLDETLSVARSFPAEGRGAIVATGLQGARRRLSRAREQVADRAARELAPLTPILLISYSGSVVAACVMMQRVRRSVRVVVCESRPKREGLLLARRLTRGGCRVTLITDAAMGTWIPRCGAVLLGCDWADRHGFINKTGSKALSALAEDAGIPVYVLADRFRVSERVFRPRDLPQYDPRDLVAARDAAIAVDNLYFEHVPWRAAHRLVTEDGIMTASEPAARTSARRGHNGRSRKTP